jgi:hypothetical protein
MDLRLFRSISIIAASKTLIPCANRPSIGCRDTDGEQQVGAVHQLALWHEGNSCLNPAN